MRRALDMKAAGGTYAAIAAELGVADTTVFKWVQYAKTQPAGWPTPSEVAAREAEDQALAERRAHRAALQAAYTKQQYLLRVDRLMVPTLGATRRLQALAALGWTALELGERLGVSGTRVGHLQAGKYPVLHRSTAGRVAALYDELSMQVPADPEETPRHVVRVHARQRRMAASKGWAPPLAWDDIDDPDEKPSGWRATDAPTRAEVLAEVDEDGGNIFEACRRLNVRRHALERWCERHDHRDTFSRLVRRANPEWAGSGAGAA